MKRKKERRGVERIQRYMERESGRMKRDREGERRRWVNEGKRYSDMEMQWGACFTAIGCK